MKLRVMSVFDVKVGLFAAPFLVRTLGEGIRSFTDACADEKLPFRVHPEDYRLFDLGEFDDQSGKYNGLDGPTPVIGAAEIVVSGE